MRAQARLWPLLLAAACAARLAAGEIVIETAAREINLVSQVTTVTYKLRFANTGKQAVDEVEVCVPADHAPHATFIEFAQGDAAEETQPLKLQPSASGREAGAACFSARLQQPLAPGGSTELQGAATLTQLQTPYPAAIFQNEPQRVLYADTLHLLSPYPVRRQTTKVKLPSGNVESHTKAPPTKLAGSSLTYGPYADTPAFAAQPLRLHFEQNSPFTVATALVREWEVSHWGNVYVEERYTVKHLGAKLRGEWSRLDMMRDPGTFGQAAVRGFVAALPPRAHSLYFKDAIGNISTSAVRRTAQQTELALTPRFPLYGGWQAEFTLGYSIPLEDAVLRDPATGVLRLVFTFGTPIVGLPVQQLENRIVLPEGAAIKGIEGPFTVADTAVETKHTYLDTSGRPVLVLRKANLAFEQNQAFAVAYSFSAISLLREPLLLVAVFLLGFALVIAFNRADFALSPDPAAKARLRVAALVKQLEADVAEKERQAAAVSAGKEAAALQERLKQGDAQLRARCQELERLGAQGHGARLRQVVEREKAVLARVAQLAEAKQ